MRPPVVKSCNFKELPILESLVGSGQVVLASVRRPLNIPKKGPLYKLTIKDCYFQDEDCSVVFQWKTPVACPPVVKECIISKDSVTYDLTALSQIESSWVVSDFASGYK